MKLSTEIKQYFRKLGIPVRCNTVAVKHPFVQVWISPTNPPNDHRSPLKYEHEFPVELRRKLLRVIYGENFAEKQAKVGCSDASAGNIKEHSISVNEREWKEATAWDKVDINAANLNVGGY